MPTRKGQAQQLALIYECLALQSYTFFFNHQSEISKKYAAALGLSRRWRGKGGHDFIMQR